ncbi:MAG: AbrB/MazE/SpoVT family DNA-binding domain-containing protein [Sarcina sp.]
MAGINRKLDELGRVVVPATIRRKLNWGERELINIEVKNNSVILTKDIKGCCICGSEENINYKVFGRDLCKDCKKKIGEL